MFQQELYDFWLASRRCYAQRCLPSERCRRDFRTMLQEHVDYRSVSAINRTMERSPMYLNLAPLTRTIYAILNFPLFPVLI